MTKPYYGAYSEERAPFSGTAFYTNVDGKEVEVTMVTNDLGILESYLKSNKDSVPVGQILRSSLRKGKHGAGELDGSNAHLSLYGTTLGRSQDDSKL